jgi:hypothetical protein
VVLALALSLSYLLEFLVATDTHLLTTIRRVSRASRFSGIIMVSRGRTMSRVNRVSRVSKVKTLSALNSNTLKPFLYSPKRGE